VSSAKYLLILKYKQIRRSRQVGNIDTRQNVREMFNNFMCTNHGSYRHEIVEKRSIYVIHAIVLSYSFVL
jgi:hypothetical protein